MFAGKPLRIQSERDVVNSRNDRAWRTYGGRVLGMRDVDPVLFQRVRKVQHRPQPVVIGRHASNGTVLALWYGPGWNRQTTVDKEMNIRTTFLEVGRDQVPPIRAVAGIASR